MTVVVEISDSTARALTQGDTASKGYFNAVGVVVAFVRHQLEIQVPKGADANAFAILAELDDAVPEREQKELTLAVARFPGDSAVHAVVAGDYGYVEKRFTDEEIDATVDLHLFAEGMLEEWSEASSSTREAVVAAKGS